MKDIYCMNQTRTIMNCYVSVHSKRIQNIFNKEKQVFGKITKKSIGHQ